MTKSLICELTSNTVVNSENFILQFVWDGLIPKAGQFFMIRPVRSSVFLGRPISIFEFNSSHNIVKFLITKRGKGTEELSQLCIGEKVELIGPLGNAWENFLPEQGKVALVGGSAGIAPLAALMSEQTNILFHFYAGFKNGFAEKEEELIMLGAAKNARKLIITAEDGKNAFPGRVVDYIYEQEKYDALFACGPLLMLKAIKEKCKTINVPCFLSMEQRMACGVGSCLGCTIKTVNGNRRCCSDGPIFPAQEINFDE